MWYWNEWSELLDSTWSFGTLSVCLSVCYAVTPIVMKFKNEVSIHIEGTINVYVFYNRKLLN